MSDVAIIGVGLAQRISSCLGRARTGLSCFAIGFLAGSCLRSVQSTPRAV